jgi:hypothetical protein
VVVFASYGGSMTRRRRPHASFRRGAAAGLLGLSLLAITGCSALIAPSGIWFRVVDGELEVSPCRDLEIDRIVLQATLTEGGTTSARWEGDAVSVAVGDALSVPPDDWTGEGLDLDLTDRAAWERISVNLAGPAGDHRSIMYGPSEAWDYAAVGGMFVVEPDRCDPPAE